MPQKRYVQAHGKQLLYGHVLVANRIIQRSLAKPVQWTEILGRGSLLIDGDGAKLLMNVNHRRKTRNALNYLVVSPCPPWQLNLDMDSLNIFKC